MAAPPVVSPGPPVGATPVGATPVGGPRPPPPPPAVPVSTRAIRPNKGFACCALYTICTISVLEFFSWWIFTYGIWHIAIGAGCCVSEYPSRNHNFQWIACIIGIVSVAWFHKIMNIVSLAAVLLTGSFIALMLGLWVGGIYGQFGVGNLVLGGVLGFIGAYGGTVVLINGVQIGLHAYLAYWISKGCPGATPPPPEPVIVAAPPVVVATPQPVMVAQPQVVVAQPMY